jgi:bifunctional non-homologous end joining protein LigD
MKAGSIEFSGHAIACLIRNHLINAGSVIIDGEIVVPAADGTTDFSVLQNELRGKSNRLVMIAFDLLYLNGQDLRKLPLIARKAHVK